MVITRKVLNEIIKDEYEKLLTEAVEEATHMEEEGQLEEEGMGAGEKIIAAAVIAAAIGAMAKNAANTDAMVQKAAELKNVSYDREALNIEFQKKYGRFLIGPTPGMGTQRPFMIDAAVATEIGDKIEWDGKSAPQVKGAGPAKPVVPPAQQSTKPTGTTNVKKMEERAFPKPKTAAPSKLG